MATKKEKEKQELMEKVFGKNAPNRRLTEKDLEALTYRVSDDLEELSPEWKALQENSKKLQAETEKILSSFSEQDFENLKNELRKDFGDTLPAEEQEKLTIMQQKPLNDVFENIETVLNAEVLCQKDYIHTLATAFRRPSVKGVQTSGLRNTILIYGENYTGRHSSLTRIVRLLQAAGYLNKETIGVVDLSRYQGKEDENNLIQDLYTAINTSQVILFDHIEQITPIYTPYIEEIITTGELVLNKRYVLNKQQMVETQTSLMKDTVKTLNFKGHYIVFITTLKPDKLLNIVGTRFIQTMGDVIHTQDIKKEHVKELFPSKFAAFADRCKENLKFRIEADDSFEKYAEDNYMDSENVSYLNKLFDRCYEALAEYKLKDISDEAKTIKISSKDNLIQFATTAEEEVDMESLLPKFMTDARLEVKEELDNIVGLEEIKNYVLSLEDFYEAQKLREKQGLKTTEVSKHMIFTGNPGTGKTTIARLLAKYLKSIGVLSNGQLIEVTRNDLVGKYMGHTAPQTMQVVKSALGGVLFIDEAYSLYRGTNDSFGLEAIDTIVKAMEDYRDDLIVILAGYTKEMKEFLESNSGLQSRFPNQIEFPDYTGDELYQIACIQAKSKGYKIDENAREGITEYFDWVQAKNDRRSGNGRLARNLVEEAILNQSKRILADTNQQLDLLELRDFNLNKN